MTTHAYTAATHPLPRRISTTSEDANQHMKTVVLERNTYGRGVHRCHAGFLDYAKHAGFLPRLCQPYRARTKGKVERFVGI